MRMRPIVAALLALTSLVAMPGTAEAALPLDAQIIEQVMEDLGLPVGAVDGIWDKDTGRATCVWRELTGRRVLRSWPVVAERPAVKATRDLPVPAYLRKGININLQCQAAVWVVVENVPVESVLIDPLTGETRTATTMQPRKVIRRIMPVSTGMAAFPTVAGVHRVGWTVNNWWQSTIYPDGRMYRPFFFHRGQALHGSSSDSLVKWYPASHGCVRMLHADIDALWDGGFRVGDTVNIYGTWQG